MPCPVLAKVRETLSGNGDKGACLNQVRSNSISGRKVSASTDLPRDTTKETEIDVILSPILWLLHSHHGLLILCLDCLKRMESCDISDEKGKERERDREVSSSSPAASKLVVLTGGKKVSK